MPASTSTRPAPIGSGSSVMSGRCCAPAGTLTPSDAHRTPSATHTRARTVGLVMGSSEGTATVEQNRDRPVVDEMHLHRGLKDTRLDAQALIAQPAHDVVEQSAG